MAWAVVELTEEPTPTCIRAEAGTVGGLQLIAGADAAALELFDGDPLIDGTLVETLEAATTLTQTKDLGRGIGLHRGIYVQMVGDGAVGYVRYK